MKGKAIIIRQTHNEDLNDVLAIHKAAFGQNDEAQLVANLLADPSAKPCLSLIAFVDSLPVGHILFSKVVVNGVEDSISAVILAPLAVMPEFQKQAIGSRLIREGLAQLAAVGTALVFVLGHPDYYPRLGFHPAGKHGFAAPYPIPPEHADAWMVQELIAGALDSNKGQVICADALSKPEYWSEQSQCG